MAATIGPTVCELDGPIPILNKSKILIIINYQKVISDWAEKIACFTHFESIYNSQPLPIITYIRCIWRSGGGCIGEVEAGEVVREGIVCYGEAGMGEVQEVLFVVEEALPMVREDDGGMPV